MRFAVAILLASLTLVSCKGEKGEKGDSGSQGPSAAPPVSQQPRINEFTGTVGSGTAFIGTFLQTNSVVLVYLQASSSDGRFVLLSFDSGVDPWCEISYPVSAVIFHNAPSTFLYKILVIQPEV